MFKINNIDTRTTSAMSFWCLYHQLWTYCTPISSVSIVDFKQVIVCFGTSNILNGKEYVLPTKDKRANSENNTKKEYMKVVQSSEKRQENLSVLLYLVVFIVDFEQMFSFLWTAKKIKSSVKDFLSECEFFNILSALLIWSRSIS